MKNSIRKLTALALVLAMVLSMSALAAKETPSKGFKLPAVKERATEAPAAPDAPAEEGAESEAPAATEVPAEGEPAQPEATQAPAQEEAPAEPETVIGKAYVSLENADSTLNVRAAATTESDRLGSLNHGDEVSVVGYEGDWTKIKFAGATGYVKSSFLSDAPAAPEATEEPVVEPTEEPVVEPTEEPVVEPTEEPVVDPTEEPVVEATEEPVVEATEEPVVEPTEEPVVEATEEPVVEATEVPELETTEEPEVTAEPTAEPTVEPSVEPEVQAEVEIPVTVGDADVRLEGDGLSEIFVTLPEGTELVVLEVVGDWVKVEVDGQIGYIYIDSVSGVEIEEEELPEDVLPEPTVTIFSSRRAVMEMGETVYLTSKLKNGEGYEIVYQWACDKGQGNGFELVEGATSDSYSFTASVETLAYDWQLLVFYKAIV